MWYLDNTGFAYVEISVFIITIHYYLAKCDLIEIVSIHFKIYLEIIVSTIDIVSKQVLTETVE